MDRFKIIAFTHKSIDIDDIGKFHIDDDHQQKDLQRVKEKMDLTELMYLSTCNRVEFAIVNDNSLNSAFLFEFFETLFPNWNQCDLYWAVKHGVIHEGDQAVRHIFSTAASIDSLVIGEREIITQVRKAYDNSAKMGLTGDFIRLVVKHTIETAKQVYTETDIAKNPVSVVSLAYRELREIDVPLDARVLVIGSGETNDNLSKYIKKHGFKNFTVFNRTLSNALPLAENLKGEALPLTELKNYTKGFDVIMTCTGSQDAIVDKPLYENLLQGDDSRKVVIDLAVPSDIHPDVVEQYAMHYIGVKSLNEVAEKNKLERAKDLKNCWNIIEENICRFNEAYRVRQVELAMKKVPQTVKQIKKTALEEVFGADLASFDASTREKLGEIVDYFEKKYISLPMKMAREIIVGEVSKKA